MGLILRSFVVMVCADIRLLYISSNLTLAAMMSMRRMVLEARKQVEKLQLQLIMTV